MPYSGCEKCGWLRNETGSRFVLTEILTAVAESACVDTTNRAFGSYPGSGTGDGGIQQQPAPSRRYAEGVRVLAS
jgi:hypothetical protein